MFGASREQIGDKIFEVAKKYVVRAQSQQNSDPVYEVAIDPDDDSALSLSTWRIRYEDESYNPTPPLTLNKPVLYVYVTLAKVPELTVEMFHKYREYTMTQARNRQVDNDLSVSIVDTPGINASAAAEQRAAIPTLITKINMPFLYARRAVVSTYYPRYDRQLGSFETVSSSIMNEQVL